MSIKSNTLFMTLRVSGLSYAEPQRIREIIRVTGFEPVILESESNVLPITLCPIIQDALID